MGEQDDAAKDESLAEVVWLNEWALEVTMPEGRKVVGIDLDAAMTTGLCDCESGETEEASLVIREGSRRIELWCADCGAFIGDAELSERT